MLVRSIISQQISTSAARSIRKRLQELVGPGGLVPTIWHNSPWTNCVGWPIAAEGVLCCRPGAKVNDGTVDLRQIGRLPDERIVEQLTQVKGIGRWTADVLDLLAGPS